MSARLVTIRHNFGHHVDENDIRSWNAGRLGGPSGWPGDLSGRPGLPGLPGLGGLAWLEALERPAWKGCLGRLGGQAGRPGGLSGRPGLPGLSGLPGLGSPACLEALERPNLREGSLEMRPGTEKRGRKRVLKPRCKFVLRCGTFYIKIMKCLTLKKNKK